MSANQASGATKTLGLEQTWTACLDQLESTLTHRQYKRYLMPAEVVFVDGRIRIIVPDEEAREELVERVLPQLPREVLRDPSVVEVLTRSELDASPQNMAEGERLWAHCLAELEAELPEQQFVMWIRPLQAINQHGTLTLLAPNRFVVDWCNENIRQRIEEIIGVHRGDNRPVVNIEVSAKSGRTHQPRTLQRQAFQQSVPGNRLNAEFAFENFVEGKSNQLARVAAIQVAENLGQAYNPLFIYGGVGLGKTHLLQAIGNRIREHRPGARVAYVTSERFVADIVRALQHNAINGFKDAYRSLDALLIDDIQFFAGKDRSQEEFFHTFNALFEGQQQIILTCDRYPKEVDGMEERLKSRFGWGLTVAIEPPEVETCVAILKQKAQQSRTDLPDAVAFFIAQRLRGNVRDLEGALRRVTAHSHLHGRAISIDVAKQALRDILSSQDRRLTIDSVQRTVASYYKIRTSDLLSKRRSKAVTHPRQMAMALCRELTKNSFADIGDAFGGRDNTTVIHACLKVKERRQSQTSTSEDYSNLLRTLTG